MAGERGGSAQPESSEPWSEGDLPCSLEAIVHPGGCQTQRNELVFYAVKYLGPKRANKYYPCALMKTDAFGRWQKRKKTLFGRLTVFILNPFFFNVVVLALITNAPFISDHYFAFT